MSRPGVAGGALGVPGGTVLLGLGAALICGDDAAAQTARPPAPQSRGVEYVIDRNNPDAIAAKGEVVLTVHAEGAQVYDCKGDPTGKLTWQFREPVATLIQDGKTIGRHYAGPTWEHVDGSRVVGKLVGRADGATTADIPWLKLDVVESHGAGVLAGVAVVQRVATKGGQYHGDCDKAGATLAAPYAADYVFLKK